MAHQKRYPSATMKDVALRAGVSVATVSRTLKSPEKVSSLTRQKIEQAILDTGYYTNNVTKHLKYNHIKTLLVIVPNIQDPFFNDIIYGIEEVAVNYGYIALVGDFKHQGHQEEAFINWMIAKQSDGIVLLGSTPPFALSLEHKKNLPPIVMANKFIPELKLPTVHIDNLTAAFKATYYLHQLGHKYIACISGDPSMLMTQYRLEGYKKAILRTGFPLQKDYIIHSDFTYEGGIEAINELLSLPNPPTAVFCHNDIMAIGASWQAKQRGLTLPDDLSVVGFDNLTISQYCDPALTTIEQPRKEIGRQVMQLLLEQLQESPPCACSRLLEANLIIRESAVTLKS